MRKVVPSVKIAVRANVANMKGNYSNLRIAVCEHTGKEVVQERDFSEPSHWLCMHNDEENDDLNDVLELRSAILPNFKNPYLKLNYG